MKTWRQLIWVLLLAAFAGGDGWANELHPEFPLLDASGRPVLLSGRPLSTMETCGGCHDAVFIESSSDHADAGAAHLGGGDGLHAWASGPGFFGSWDALRYDLPLAADGSINSGAWLRRFGPRHVGGGPVSEWLEMDCLMCHSDITDVAPRQQALAEGDFAWANSARLSVRGIVLQQDGRWAWNPFMFQADGSLNEGLLAIRKPRDENCAQCHGQVGTGLEEPLTLDADPARRAMTERTGQVISPQKLSDSGLNLAGKESLTRPFDVHAERVVGCVNCHYSLNNPVYFQQRPESRPPHLAFDPRRLTNSDYLTRPLHQFAKGNTTFGLGAVESENSLRRCSACHDASGVHEWLPYKERHFASLACEACHVPQLHGPALQMLDWTLVDADGQPRRTYREVEGDPATADSLIKGFRPAMLARDNVDGKRKLAPFNLVSSWYWLAGEPARPVDREELVAALYPNGVLAPELLRALDLDGNGRLDGVEWRLDTADRADAVREHLEAAGLDAVRLAAEVTRRGLRSGRAVRTGRVPARRAHARDGAGYDACLAGAIARRNRARRRQRDKRLRCSAVPARHAVRGLLHHRPRRPRLGGPGRARDVRGYFGRRHGPRRGPVPLPTGAAAAAARQGPGLHVRCLRPHLALGAGQRDPAADRHAAAPSSASCPIRTTSWGAPWPRRPIIRRASSPATRIRWRRPGTTASTRCSRSPISPS
jgi:cytochrome c553